MSPQNGISVGRSLKVHVRINVSPPLKHGYWLSILGGNVYLD